LNPFGIEDNGAVFAAADGISGHAGGDTAGRMNETIDKIRSTSKKGDPL
jgi:hypothetical protein